LKYLITLSILSTTSTAFIVKYKC